MNVYELRAADNAIALAYCDRSEYTRQHELTGRPADLARWSPPAVEIVRDGSGGTEPSDIMLLGVEPALTARAVACMGDLLRAAGQVLPLLSADGEYYL